MIEIPLMPNGLRFSCRRRRAAQETLKSPRSRAPKAVNYKRVCDGLAPILPILCLPHVFDEFENERKREAVVERIPREVAVLFR